MEGERERRLITGVRKAILRRARGRARMRVRGDATPLFDGGLEIDSIGFLELVLELETMANVRLRDETLDAEVLKDVSSLIAHVVDRARSADAARAEPALFIS